MSDYMDWPSFHVEVTIDGEEHSFGLHLTQFLPRVGETISLLHPDDNPHEDLEAYHHPRKVLVRVDAVYHEERWRVRGEMYSRVISVVVLECSQVADD